jgi:3',5'-cyclic-nucleotide phosphodiesterase
MVGALGHDAGHPGLNNLYFQKLKHPLAQTSNDQAVLEMYHGYILQWLLSKPENDILAGLTAPEKTRFRKATLEAILGTDMTKHFMLCQ